MKHTLVFLPLVVLACCRLLLVRATEVQATREWTLLGENDTVAAGMHIRMDLGTGQKWVKLLDEDDDDQDQQKAEVEARSGAVILASREVKDEKEEEPQYDFEMMHRALSKLPDEEKERIQLPELPSADRQVFEQRMIEIWNKRQEQLRQFEQENIADLPQLLKDRIQRIQTYLQDPVHHLRKLKLDDGGDGDHEDDDDGIVTHIVSVLKDLEYQLSDIDMARDFITMGGWNLLVSLISDEAHDNASTKNATITRELMDKVYTVQTHAAWALGTAVKNTGEFAHLALAPVHLVAAGHNGQQQPIAALDLIVRQYAAVGDKGQSAAVRSNRNHKLLYALGAVLRGNRPAQVHFCAGDGPSVLAHALFRALDDAESLTEARKTIQRLLALADDIVVDVKLHPAESELVNAGIVGGFSTSTWCDSALAALQLMDAYAVQEKALRMIHSVAAECAWNKDAVVKALEKTRVVWQASAEERDGDFQRELLGLLDSTLEKVR